MPNRAAGMFVGSRPWSWTRAGSSPGVFQGPRDKSRPLYSQEGFLDKRSRHQICYCKVFNVLRSKYPLGLENLVQHLSRHRPCLIV